MSHLLQAIRWLGRGVRQDVHSRLLHYADDWRQARSGKLRVLAASTYIFCASAIPALAFGEQLYAETGGMLTAVQVLAATAITGVAQAVVGGQPLLIVGVAEPIVLIYKYMHAFAKDKEGLGPDLFLAWCAWACVWSAILILLLAAGNACAYTSRFTRLAGELFGALIALLFVQQAIKGCVEEFRAAPQAGGSSDASPTWHLVNGLWSLLLAFGLLLTSLLLRQARSWRFLRASLRGFLADYGAALVLVAFTGLSFAVGGGGGIPRRVHSPNTWDVKSSWRVAGDMGSVSGRWVAAALVPAALITLLFFFDHNVSAQLAQQAEFNLAKPPAYHWDFMLLGVMTLVCGLLGLPPVNGVLPQSPMHTKALAQVAGRRSGSQQQGQQQEQGQQEQGQQEKERQLHLELVNGGRGKVAAGAAGNDAAGPGRDSSRVPVARCGRGMRLSPSMQAILPAVHSSSNLAAAEAAAAASAATAVGEAPPAAAVAQKAADKAAAAAAAKAAAAACPFAATAAAAAGAVVPLCEGESVVAVQVLEQRVSGLLQSLAVGACLAAMPAIRQIPAALLWAYFAFMAIESLPGSQLWDRLLLLLTDPQRRPQLLERGHAPYLETVPYRVIVWFTLFQVAYLLAVYGITWAGIAGILFPVPIMLLVPLRQWVMPRCFRQRRHLQELDAAHQERAAPLSHAQAVREAAARGLAAPAAARMPPGLGSTGGASDAEGGVESDDGFGDLDDELHHFRVVHHLSRESVLRRRRSLQELDEATAAAAAAGVPFPGSPLAGGRLPGAPLVRSPRGSASVRRRSQDLQV